MKGGGIYDCELMAYSMSKFEPGSEKSEGVLRQTLSRGGQSLAKLVQKDAAE